MLDRISAWRLIFGSKTEARDVYSDPIDVS
jgi:hypothetical protein